jgi:hypothetical protein
MALQGRERDGGEAGRPVGGGASFGRSAEGEQRRRELQGRRGEGAELRLCQARDSRRRALPCRAAAVENGAPPLEEEWDVRGVLHPSPSRRESSSPLSSGSLAEGAGEVPPLAYGRGEADWKGRASPWLASGGRARRGCAPGVASPATLPCPDRRRRLEHGAWRRCWH